MTNNRRRDDIDDRDVLTVRRAQNKVLHVRDGVGNWRGVGKLLGINHVYAWAFALWDEVPPNPEIRKKLFLPRTLPSERKQRNKRAIPLLGSPGWEDAFFKVPRKRGRPRKAK